MLDKIAYIGHAYHLKTKSTEFLINYFKEFFNVDVFTDTSWEEANNSEEGLNHEQYKAVVFFQLLPKPEDLKKINNNNIIFFPMFDGSGKNNFEFWWNYKDLKFINFSKTLHEKLSNWGFDSSYVQFFIEPKEFSPGNNDEVFFWNRIEQININSVKTLLEGNDDVKIHIHKALDPNRPFVEPSEDDIQKFSITFSDWFETKEEMQNVIKQKGIYIAPREYEGIGMSFLEAMAMGKIVIANNQPTMNEYIKHGENGYLCDFSNPKPIKLLNIEQIQKNTYAYMQEGYKNWLINRKNIVEKINSPVNKKRNLKFKLILNAIILCNFKLILRLKIGKRGYLYLFNKKII